MVPSSSPPEPDDPDDQEQEVVWPPFPEDWLAFLETNVAHYQLLSESEQARLQEGALTLVAEKSWEGCRGLVVADEMRVTIAAQACLMLLGVEHDCFRRVQTILIYPSGFRVTDEYWQEEGWAPMPASGQAIYGGPVILAWDAVLAEGRDPSRGRNVVIHEFAHQLDFVDGSADGTLDLVGEQADRWNEVMLTEYDGLCRRVRKGRNTFLGDYAATNRSEFFAVASERFFTRPAALRHYHPALYEVLAETYALDPVQWFAETAQRYRSNQIQNVAVVGFAVRFCDNRATVRPTSFAERRMRVYALLGVATCLAFAARADSGNEATADRVANLIRQLGHEEFAKREAASKELDAIGAPALDALRMAASQGDPEVRRRAAQIVQAVTGRIRAAAAKQELAKWHGDWSGAGGEKLAIQGDQWVSSTPTFGPVSGTFKGIDVREKMTLVDLVVEAGPTKGRTAKVIFRIDGDTLHYCGTYDATSPTDFKTQGTSVYIAWKRGKNPAAPAVAQPVAPPADVQYEGDAFSTDLPLAESKEPVHRVFLKCRLADGGSGTLTLDPNVPRFDEFGDPVAGGKKSPLVTLDCTLKLVKKDEGRQLYELRGPKIVSRLSLVACKDIMPWGDGRLLVHGKGGEVKYVIDLQRPQIRTKPCHPGCFPAGTPVRVPDGARPIERIREGDLVTTIDADGKLSSARVTGVFVTRNRILEVRVDGGKLVTTETQPVGLEAGGFRPAGELKAGDRIWRWVGAERRAVAVLGVSAADRETDVFNLVLGEPKGFIAGDFLVRSKPPAALARPGAEDAGAVAPTNHGRRLRSTVEQMDP